MNLAPFDVQPIAERIKTLNVLRLVGLAADYASVKSLRDFVVPSVYVVLAQERFDNAPAGYAPRDGVAQVSQPGDVSVGVIIAGRNYREQQGAQLSDEMRGLVGQVRQQLHGWVPPVPGARAMQIQRGDLLQYDNATALWCDVWTTKTLIGAEAQ